jgi:hypothetical protein
MIGCAKRDQNERGKNVNIKSDTAKRTQGNINHGMLSITQFEMEESSEHLVRFVVIQKWKLIITHMKVMDCVSCGFVESII